MLDLSRKLTDELVLGDDVYQLNIAFNKVLKVMELINDDEFDDDDASSPVDSSSGNAARSHDE